MSHVEMYGQEIGITAAYNRQHALDSNLQEIRKKRELRRQLEAEEANRKLFRHTDVLELEIKAQRQHSLITMSPSCPYTSGAFTEH